MAMSTNYMAMSTKYIHVHKICMDSQFHTQANEKDAKLVFNMDEREQRDK